MHESKIILDLCGGRLGNWSKPYSNAGYDVRVVDILTGGNVMTYIPPENVYGILAAPPCTMFSYLRTVAKTPRDLEEGMKVVRACMNIIWKCQELQQETRHKKTSLKFWSLENPYYGMMKNFLGKPAFVFDPYQFGDEYGKKTSLWGHFNEPVVSHVKPKLKKGSLGHTKFDHRKSKDIHPEHFGVLSRTERRSITPAGFAQAFFKANP